MTLSWPISEVQVNRSSPVPLYFQVAEQLEGAIHEGRLSPGDRISNELVLATELGLSRPTVRQAIQVLVDKGLLVRRRGVGTQVVHGRIRRSVELTSLHDDLAAAGQEQQTEVLSVAICEADDTVAAELEVQPGDPAWRLERVRSVNGKPLALMRNYLPKHVIDLDGVDFSKSGLYETIRRANINLRVARQKIGAQRATAREARLLKVSRGAPLLNMQRTAYDDQGRAVELGQHVYRADLYAFELTLIDR